MEFAGGIKSHFMSYEIASPQGTLSHPVRGDWKQS